MRGIRVLEAGPRALLVELDSGEDAEAFHAELLRRRAAGELPAVREIVPGARTVLLDGVEDRTLAGRMPSWTVPPLSRGAVEAVEIPVVYDGPDLADVAEAWGVAVDEVPRIHARAEFRVAFCGFAPGFAYLTGLPAHLSVERRATPRTRSVAGRWPSPGRTPGSIRVPRPAAGRSSAGCPDRTRSGTRDANPPRCSAPGRACASYRRG